MYGTFHEDIARWMDIWSGHAGVKHSLLGKMQQVWAHPALRAIGLFRLSTLCARHRFPLLPGFFRRLNLTLFGLDMPAGLPIGGGLYIPHPVGTVVMAQCIGRNVTLVSNVTIGMRGNAGFPIIGDNVYIGAGARILGGVTIGSGASIGANAVVLTDVPAGATAVGVPARIIRRDETEQLDTTVEA